MGDITKVPVGRLILDLEDSYADLGTCEAAQALGITFHNCDIAERAEKNRMLIKVIKEELERRKAVKNGSDSESH